MAIKRKKVRIQDAERSVAQGKNEVNFKDVYSLFDDVLDDDAEIKFKSRRFGFHCDADVIGLSSEGGVVTEHGSRKEKIHETVISVFRGSADPDCISMELETSPFMEMDRYVELRSDGSVSLHIVDCRDNESIRLPLEKEVPVEMFMKIHRFLSERFPDVVYSIQPTEEFSESGWDTEWGVRSADDALYEATGLTPNDAFRTCRAAEEFFRKDGGLDDKCYCIKKVRPQDVAIPRDPRNGVPEFRIVGQRGRSVREFRMKKVMDRKLGHHM